MQQNKNFNLINMIKFNYYNQEKELDRAWFDSSNVLYGECDDSSSTQEKTVTLVFKGGLQYLYEGVNIGDWIDFKNSQSQGKALNEIFKAKGYEYRKLEDKKDIEELENEYILRSNKGIFMGIIEDAEEFKELVITDSQDKVIGRFKLGNYSSDDVPIFLLDIKKVYQGLGFKVSYSDEIQDIINNIDFGG